MINTMKRKIDELLSKEQRRSLNDELIHFFKKENDIDIGIIFADELIDLFLKKAGIQLYNKGIDTSKERILNQIENLEVDIDALKK